MKIFPNRLAAHIARVQRQIGARAEIGSQSYVVKGYYANNFHLGDTHEPHLVAPLERAMKATSGLIIDVGVNLGQTLTKILSIDPTRPYLGFEPQIGACFFVSRFLSDNHLTHMSVLPVGLSDKNTSMTFYSDGDADVMGTTIPNAKRSSGLAKRHIQVRVGDDVLKELDCSTPGIVKIDVEGAELQVLAGLKNTIERSRPIVFFEQLPNFFGADRQRLPEDECIARTTTAAEIFKFFAQRNYEIRQINKAGEEQKISHFELDDAASFAGSDYVAYPL